MKKSLNIALVLISAFSLFSVSAHAVRLGNKTHHKTTQKDTIRTTSSQSATRYSSAYPQLGLGISSLSVVTRASAYAVSALILLNKKMTLHTLFGINSTSPFQFGLGGIMKFNVIGTPYAGLHLGGGLGLGQGATGGAASATAFYVNILGNVGVHFQFPSLNNIAISFDAGPALRIFENSLGESTTDFYVGGLGDILGLSIHFMLD